MIALHRRLPRPSGLCSERSRKSQRSRQPNKALQICQSSFAFESPVEEMKLPDTTRRRSQSTKCEQSTACGFAAGQCGKLRLSATSFVLLTLRPKHEA